MRYKNIYFVNGNAYAGKSTLVKELAKRFDGILCCENYHERLLDDLDPSKYPNLTYIRDLKDWGSFVRRTPNEYLRWVEEGTIECENLELKILDELDKTGKLVFVDTNIRVETLKQIVEKNHVIIMLAPIDVSCDRFFDRIDLDKNFIYNLLLKEDNPTKAIDNFKECLRLVNSQEKYNAFLNSSFNVILRDESRSIDETVEIAIDLFHLKKL